MDLFPFIALSYLINAQFNMHASALYVMHRNFDVFLFNFCNVLLFAVTSWLAVPRLGILGYGWGEIAAFASYIILHHSISRRLGSPSYQLVAIWCAGTAFGTILEVSWRLDDRCTVCRVVVASFFGGDSTGSGGRSGAANTPLIRCGRRSREALSQENR